MFIWVVILALLAASVIGFFREPRRLRVGVLLLSALALTGLSVLGLVMGRLDDPYDETAAWLLLGIIAIGLLSLVTLAGFLIINGLLMLRRESLSPANLLSLVTGLALLGYIGTGFFALARNDAALAIWLILSVPPVAYVGFVFSAFLVYAWIYAKLAPARSGPVSAVVVLGAGLIHNRVTPLLAGRLSKGIEVFQRAVSRNPDATIVVSGGQGADEAVPEAVAMAGWLQEQGLPAVDIITEPTSRTTRENLENSEEVLRQNGRIGPVAVVTSNYHAFRAATLMRALGIDGYSVGSPTARYFWPSAMIREFVALLRDHTRLNVAILCVLLTPVVLFTVARLVQLIT